MSATLPLVPGASRRWLWGLGGLAAALALFAFALETHVDRACVELDTPYLPLCAELPATREERRESLRQGLARNPGDANAWTRLLGVEGADGAAAVLPGAALAAPNHPYVARWRAARALQQGRMDEGIATLVDLLRNQSSPEGAAALARIAAAPDGVALLRPHLATAPEWLPAVLGASVTLKQHPGEMLALVAAAVDQGALPEGARQQYMRSLKATGQWLDAYGLWVAQHRHAVPLLFNSGFDQPIERDGFDWEFADGPRSRAGVLVEQVSVARRGLVLGFEFTGRSLAAPIARQYLFAPPGTYRLRGDYMTSKLRSEEGLAWTVQCTAGRKAVVGRSPALRESGGVWRAMEFEFTVPPDCGPVASLQLEAAASYEGVAGMKGYAAFDAFSLARTAASQ